MKKTLLAILLTAITAVFTVSPAIAGPSLIGDAIDATLTGGIMLEDLGVIVGPGVEFQGGDGSTAFGAFLFPMEFMDVGADTIDMAFDLPLGMDGMLTFSDLDFGPGIASASLSGTVNGTDVNDTLSISNTANSVTIDATDWFSAGGAGAFSVSLVPIPEPTSVLSITMALGFLALRRRG